MEHSPSHPRAGPRFMPSNERLDGQRSGNGTALYGEKVNIINTALQPPASGARPRSPPPANAAAAASSSKSALTIALQRAQSAVLLDSAQNYPAAITAYAQAVRLLRQVMARVEEGSREMERKRSSAGESGPREGESMQEWEKRKQRYERKEKHKVDEARRLKVIHDTYQDRIRMLVQMETLPPAAASPAPSTRPTTPSSPLSLSPSASHHHRRRPSSPSPLPLMDPPPLAATTDRPHPYSAAAAASTTSSSTALLLRRRDAELGDGDGSGIGAAMLELASPTYHNHHHEEGLQDDFRLPQRGAVAGGGGRRRATEPVLLLERLPVVVAAEPETSPTFPTATATATAAESTSSPRHGGDVLLSSSPRPRRRPSFASDSTATATATARDVEAITPSSPAETAAVMAPPMRRGASADALLPSSSMSPSSSAGSRSRSGSRSPRSGSASLKGGKTSPSCADARAPDIQRGYSTGSIGTNTPVLFQRSGSVSIGGLAYIEEGPVRAPIEIIRPRPARGASLGGGGGGGPFGAGAGAGSGLPTLAPTTRGTGLVNSTTMEGTISQRRQARGTTSPYPDDGGEGEDEGEGEDAFLAAAAAAEAGYEYDDRPPHATRRTLARATAGTDTDDFGRPNDSARHESWTTGSLPTRLRSDEVLDSRSGLLLLPLDWQATTVAEAEAEAKEVESLPPLPPQQQPPPPPPLEVSPTTKRRVPSSSSSSTYYHHHHRPSASTSSLGTRGGGGGPSRKGSVPTPTSLTAPSLGRSTSASSSIASNASSSFPPPLRPRRRSSTAAARRTTTAAHQPTGIYLSAGLANPPLDAASPASREAALSIPPPRRPFHLMRLVLATMSSAPTSTGGYISEKLFLPAAMWRTTPGGAATKLVALETKVRMLDLLSNGLDGLDKAGRGFLLVPIESANARAVARQEADRFTRELDSFEGLAGGVQSTLAKKLGPGVVGGTASMSAPNGGVGRKGSATSFASWSSKLSHSLNRVTNGNSLVDSQAAYVDAIAKVFRHAQCIDEHLAAILQGARSPEHDSPYDLLDRNLRLHVERYLRRCSEFFGHVVCRFVLQDVGVLLDKYVKRGGAWLSAD